jgi:hypothetical protein
MAHNHEAICCSTGIGEDRSQNLNLDEAEVFHRACLDVTPEYRLPHRWHFSNAGYAVPPLPAGAKLRTLIDESKESKERTMNLPNNSYTGLSKHALWFIILLIYFLTVSLIVMHVL